MTTISNDATAEHLYPVLQSDTAEFVNGLLFVISPNGRTPSRAAGNIYYKLVQYERRTKIGYAIPDKTGFVVDLPNRKSFNPDAAFYLGKLTKSCLQGAPIFAVEVRSEGDYGPTAEQEMASRRADYFAAGTQIIWDVDLLSDDVVRVYRACDPNTPTIYRRGERAEAEPALAGWTMRVDDLFV
jgi:Uma2 family endonuclease